MNCKKLLAAVTILLAGIVTLPREALAQWSVGVSYEIRQEDPTNGFGFRVERQILKLAPIVDLGLRAHFSYFNETNNVTRGFDTSFSREITNYDYGLAAIGGVSVGLVKPYVGMGLGASTFDISTEGFAGGPISGEDSDTGLYWNALVGAEISPIPVLKPFVEYRFQQVDEPEFVPGSDGRLIFGLSFSF